MAEWLKMRRNRVALILPAVLICCCAQAAASQLNIRHYDIRDGIPQVQVSSIHQDAQGYLWIGTYGGLARYNGHSFRAFRVGDGLKSNYINDVTAAADGTLLVGTAQGLCRRQAGEFSCLEPDSGERTILINDLLPLDDGRLWVAADEGLFLVRGDLMERMDWIAGDTTPAITALAEDASGRLWIGTSRGLYVRQAGEIAAFGPVGRSVEPVRALANDGEAIWAGTSQGLYRVNAARGTVEPVPLPVAEAVQVNAIHFTGDGALWLATVAGVFRRQNDHFDHFTTQNGLQIDITLDIADDREGMIWIASDQGLSKVFPGTFVGYSTESGLLSGFVRTINQDASGRLWLGTREGLQLVPRVDGEWRFDRAEFIRKSDGLPDERVYSIAFPAPGQAYIATAEGVIHWHESDGIVDRITREDGLADSEVHALLLDSSGRLWVSSTRGISMMTEDSIRAPADETLADAFALRIREDNSGRLWFSTLRSGLLIAKPDGSVVQLDSNDGLTDEMLWDLAPSVDGSMWVGSNGDGLFRVWPDGRIRQFTTADGLSNDAVWQVLEDDQGRVWAYTNHGISRLENDRFTNYSERDGLLHLEGGATGALQTDDGLLWFASADGLMRYDPEREHSNDIPPPVVIESVDLEGRPVTAESRLPYRHGSLEFEYAGLSFQDESAVRFRYRLLGASDQWSAPTENRRVTYAALGHGHYTFEVLARNPDGVWSVEPAQFRFSVESPFWSTWWFFALAALCAGLGVWGIVHIRLRRLEAGKAQLQELVDLRTTELSRANERLQKASRTDQLTGLPNRRFLFDRIGEDIARSRRAHHGATRRPNSDIAFLMIDLDEFKKINDEHGHDAGDRILKQFAGVVDRALRETDYVVRWGGEEFVVVACEAESEAAGAIAERVVCAVRQEQFVLDDAGTPVELTCSIGLACFPFQPDDPAALDWEQTVQLADIGVYEGKKSGKDCWVQLTAGESMTIDSGAEFVECAKSGLDELVEKGMIRKITSLGRSVS